MNKRFVLSVLAASIGLAGCGSDDDSASRIVVEPSVDNCKDMDNLYFCDGFSTDNMATNWKVLAVEGANDGTAAGTFDIPANKGYLRYNAGGKGGEILLASDAAMADVPSGNYFVEAKIRPRQNGTTANKQIFLMGRYDSEGNWFGGGLNVQNSPSSTQVEAVISTDGSISRPVQSKRPIALGTRNTDSETFEDGTWYVTRFEMIDNHLSVYLDGEFIGTTDSDKYQSTGKFGLFTNNRAFEIDYIKVGDPTIKPVQLTLDYMSTAWENAVAGGDPLVVNVTAVQSDGTTEDTYEVSSSDEDVVLVNEVNGQVTIEPMAEGTAVITFISGSDADLTKSIAVTVNRAFVMPTADYGDLSGKLMPAIDSTEQFIDGQLSITFDDDITLGEIGEIRIYKNGTTTDPVDTIKAMNELNVLGYEGQDKRRVVNFNPLSVGDDGKTLKIALHDGVLDYGTSYYVVIGEGLVKGSKLNGNNFVGLGANSNWKFTTKSAPATGADVTVGPTGQFASVQGALTYLMKNVDKNAAKTVTVQEGTYEGLLFLRSVNNVTIKGAGKDKTFIQYDNYDTLNGGGGKSSAGTSSAEGGRAVFLVETVDNLVLEDLTLKNTHVRSSAYSNQAETIYFNSPYRLIAKNANFISEQDTLLLKGYTWFYNTLVAGNVDFIWGYSVASVFENSEIRTLGDSKSGVEVETSGGYVLQARTANEGDPGFVFINSKFTSGVGPVGNTVKDGSTYFARSSGKSNAYDNVVLINSQVGPHIADIGWAGKDVNGQPAPKPASATSGWREYASQDLTGNALDVTKRESGIVLSAEEAAPYLTRDKVFASYNDGSGWKPQP
ncbi:pectinesterase family protein [Agarivorans sp. Z349TD_8]|uniref:pectinesterase family protein n=1 Tax=Agarivorans sp. Z349TD_8 TaxID=3421434 RepID=UPI003D7D73D0